MEENYTPPIWRIAKTIGDAIGWTPPRLVEIPQANTGENS